MMRYVAVAALMACLGLGGAFWWQSGKIEDLAAESARLARNAVVLEIERANARLAADVAAKRAARAMKMNAEAADTIAAIRNLKLGDCADEKIDPALADHLGRWNVPAED